MNWNSHKGLGGQHAFLSPSKPHWLNYDKERLETRYENHRRAALGTKYHKFAQDAIELAVRLPNTQASLHSFVNDALGYRMEAEQMLYYSENCFGTADAICFRDGILRIHDLKTGSSGGLLEQLEVYAGLFCLEYSIDPYSIEIVLRIYHLDEIQEWFPTPERIRDVMNTIVSHDMFLGKLKDELL